jgi:hypothetical protein
MGKDVATCKNCGCDIAIDEPSGWWTHLEAPPISCKPEPLRDEFFGFPVYIDPLKAADNEG